MSAGDLQTMYDNKKHPAMSGCFRLSKKSLSLGYTSVISFSPDYDNRLPIVLFVGQHFSGSLFEWVHLSILTRERTKETRARDLTAPLPIS